MSFTVTVYWTNGTVLVREFDAVEDALSLVCDTLRRWSDNTLSVMVAVHSDTDSLGAGAFLPDRFAGS